MSELVKIQKTIYNLGNFNNAINNNFTQLATTQLATEAGLEANIDDFFEQYDILYFEIPPSGSDQSHLVLATRSLEAVGLSLEDLQSEISDLREENINLKNQILLLSNIDIGNLAQSNIVR